MTSPLIPPVMREGHHRAGNIALVLGALIGGEWLVHQVQYLIQYGARFGAVMDTTPHRYYMGPVGITLGVMGAALLALAAGLLLLEHRERIRLRRALAACRHQPAPATAGRVPTGAILRTAALIACLQTILYTAQENLEAHLMGLAMPGPAVLAHATLLPLHALTALCLSLILWAIACVLRDSHESVVRLRRLLRLHGPRSAVRAGIIQEAPPRLPAIPTRCPRAPPSAA